MTPGRRSSFIALALFALLTLVWGYNWIAMKVGLAYASPFEFLALRTGMGVIVLFAAMLVTRRPLRPQAFKGTLLLGLCQTTGFMIFITLALVAGAAGRTSVLVFTMPFWTLLLSWPLLGERIHGLRWLAILLALAGLILIVQPWHLAGTLISQFFAIMGGVMWALSAVVAKRLRQHQELDLIALTAWQMLFGSVPILILAGLIPAHPIQWNGDFLLAITYAGVLGTSGGWLLWLFVLNRVPAGTAALSALAIPVVTVIIAWLQLGERPGGKELVGMFAIAAALTLISWLSFRERRHVVSVKR